MNKTIYDIFEQAGLPAPNSTKSPDSARRGVSYYNKDNKDNKENKDDSLAPLSLDRTASLETASLDQVAEPLFNGVAKEEESRGQESLDSGGGVEEPLAPRLGIINPAILPEDVDRCLLTFYDNGEGSRMRYKLGITINPNSAPSERWEFIANLNKDNRIFRRNIPEENRNFVLDFGQSMRASTKARFRVYPLLGKIHDNSKISGSTNQKEDACAAAVYWTGSSWMATVMLWEYCIADIELTDSLVNAKQRANNVKAVSGVIYGPNSVSRAEWQKRARPTFKQRKQQK